MAFVNSDASIGALRHLFVYGTLRRGDVRDINRLHPAPRFLGNATVAGVLYHLGSYPGIVLGGEARVYGEVYEISAELEQQLDEIEEVWPQQTGEYAKRVVRAQMEPPFEAAELHCVLYEVAVIRCEGKLRIEEGDWIRHCGRAR